MDDINGLKDPEFRLDKNAENDIIRVLCTVELGWSEK
jgi:hypothetical protein